MPARTGIFFRSLPHTLDPFFTGVLGFVVAIAIGTLLPVSWPWAVCSFFLALVFACATATARRRSYLMLAVFALLLGVGLLRASFVVRDAPPEFLRLLGQKEVLTGTVIAIPDVRETSQRLTVEVGKGGAHTRVLVVAPLFTKVEVGEQVSVSGTFQKPAAFATDGGRVFDYPAFLAKDGIFLLMQRASVNVTAPPSGEYLALAYLARVRGAFMDGLSVALPEPYAALAGGLVAGGKQGLGKELLGAFTTAGLVQIVVLSGYNVMIVAEFVLLLLGRLPRRIASTIAALAIVLFVLAAGASASAVRAGIMACIALYARTSGHSYSALRALAFAVVLMLLWNPLTLLYDPGFQLSVLATLGLVLASSRVQVVLRFIKSVSLREAIATTIAAQCAVLPLLLYDTGNLSLVAFPANVLVAVATPLGMGLSFLAGIFGIIVPSLAPLLSLPAYLVLWYIVEVARIASALPFAQLAVPPFPFFVVVLAYAVLLAFLYKTKSPQAKLAATRSHSTEHSK